MALREEGRHTEEQILSADEVVKSPGIPNDAPLILKLREQGTPIISEIEFAGRYTDAKMILYHRLELERRPQPRLSITFLKAQD